MKKYLHIKKISSFAYLLAVLSLGLGVASLTQAQINLTPNRSQVVDEKIERTLPTQAIEKKEQVESNNQASQESVKDIPSTANSRALENNTNTPPTPVDVSPAATLSITDTGENLKDRIEITVSVADARSVEVYLTREGSLIPVYLGKARRSSNNTWLFNWDTKTTPNAHYTISANITNTYGTYESNKKEVNVLNLEVEEVATPGKVDAIKNIKEAKEEVIAVEKEIEESKKEVTRRASEAINSVSTELQEKIRTTNPNVQNNPTIAEQTKEIGRKFEVSLDKDLDNLLLSLRSNDAFTTSEARRRLESKREQLLADLSLIAKNQNLNEEEVGNAQRVIEDSLRTAVTEFEDSVVRKEKVIKDRVGLEVFVDSDKDGISDYDEVNLYNTEIYEADSDGDGFIDSVEIFDGFDPNNPSPEAAIAYQNPQEVGIERPDLFTVETVASQVSEEGSPEILLSGRALPNSYVTVYIFSTPIIVTVKTDNDGNWSYVLDKELEDGEHEVYVGTTDNSGRIIAKSAPLAFAKQANAVAAIQQAELAPVSSPSLFGNTAFYIVALILIILGVSLFILGYRARKYHQMHVQGQETPASGV